MLKTCIISSSAWTYAIDMHVITISAYSQFYFCKWITAMLTNWISIFQIYAILPWVTCEMLILLSSWCIVFPIPNNQPYLAKVEKTAELLKFLCDKELNLANHCPHFPFYCKLSRRNRDTFWIGLHIVRIQFRHNHLAHNVVVCSWCGWLKSFSGRFTQWT